MRKEFRRLGLVKRPVSEVSSCLLCSLPSPLVCSSFVCGKNRGNRNCVCVATIPSPMLVVVEVAEVNVDLVAVQATIPPAESLKGVIGKATGLPRDASSQKRHYLYGHPKS